MDDLKKNEIYEAAMTGFTSEGAGVCRIKGRAVFVPRALPGETWRVRIVKVTKTAVFGRGEERLTTSPERVEPDCPNFGRCGGCNLMHMSYECELQMKLDRVNDALRRIGGTEVRAERILGSERVEGYRNKAIYAVGEGENGPVAGFYRTGSHDIIPAPNCLLQSDEASKCAGAVVDWMRTNGVSAWNGRSGTVRHVYTRRARDGAALCCVVTGRRLSPSLTRSLTEVLRIACPALTGVVECVNRTEGNTVLSGDFPASIPGRRAQEGESFSVLGLPVRAFGSTDLGLSYLVEVDGRRVFHAGDFNLWHWEEESTPQEIAEATEGFERILADLADFAAGTIDLAFFPLDPRMGKHTDRGAVRFLKALRPKVLVPMHLQGDAALAERFAAQHPQVRTLTQRGQTLEID